MNRRRSKFIIACICLSTILSSLLSATSNTYVSQMESEIDPKVMCFPSSMINASIYAGYNLDTSILDVYDKYIHSDVIRNYINKYAPRYISKTLSQSDVDVREMWQIEEMSFNSFMGYKVCELKTHMSFDDVVHEIKSGNTLVTSGKLVGRSHCVAIISISEDTVTFIDPYGDPNTNYKNTDKYAIVSMDIDDFKQSFKQDNGKYTYITFDPIDSECMSDGIKYETHSRLMRDIIATEHMVYSRNLAYEFDYDYKSADIDYGYVQYIRYSEASDKLVSYLSYRKLLDNDSCILTPLVFNCIIDTSIICEVDIVLASYIQLYSELTCEPINQEYLSSAYKSSDDMETRFYISCVGYENYLFGIVPNSVKDMYTRITNILGPFLEDISDIVFLNTSFVENYHESKNCPMYCDIESRDDTNSTNAVLTVYYLYYIDNRRRLIDRICERTCKGYSLKDFSEFVITF